MSKTIQRYQIADYLNIGTDSETYELMGAGFNTLDENPAAQLDTKTYVNDRSATSTIKGYQAQFPYDTDLIASEKAVMYLYEVGRNQKTGAEAETDYVKSRTFQPCFIERKHFQSPKIPRFH